MKEPARSANPVNAPLTLAALARHRMAAAAEALGATSGPVAAGGGPSSAAPLPAPGAAAAALPPSCQAAAAAALGYCCRVSCPLCQGTAAPPRNMNACCSLKRLKVRRQEVAGQPCDVWSVHTLLP